ncbi:hypothetical protein BC936DRAFT_137020 [Jimgerdemannia flammicorona]|uniref:Uncharacterized protein n=1 Tax=Jimgerdemannia flammicorona TaxID=994334 RepID=A0A433CY93_9FUNG|nr:hypothetical protein BC936DRAFT_137020 [Jimgerdemannia flammicorona]
MWLRDSTNQRHQINPSRQLQITHYQHLPPPKVLPYVAYANKDPTLKTFLRGVVLLQARYVSHHPYANAFQAPPESGIRPTGWHSDNVFPPMDSTEVYEAKYEVDSLSAFLKISYHYHAATGDVSFVFHPIWMAAAEKAVLTMRHQQEATFDSEGRQNIPRYNFTRHAQNPTDTQFLGGNGQPIRFTGMIKSHFRPSDDSSVFPFFVPGNAMASVELEHLAQLLDTAGANKELSQQARAFSVEIRNAIYKNAVVKHPEFGDIFACESIGFFLLEC